jgi:DNA adenine methylase
MIFRYPGAKNKVLHVLGPLLDRLVAGRGAFADVFVGGGGVLLHVAKNHPKLALRANDLDPDIAAFWRVVSGNEASELCGRLHIRPTLDKFYELREQKAANRLDRAFQAIFFNRCCFSGMLHGSPIGGQAQTSAFKVFSRYNADRLVDEIKAAHKLLAGRTTVTCLDAADVVEKHPTTATYLDPPYFQKGDFLYPQRMTLSDHLRLATVLRGAENWLLTYDRSPVIAGLYSWATCRVLSARYSTAGAKTGWSRNEELVITPPILGGS